MLEQDEVVLIWLAFYDFVGMDMAAWVCKDINDYRERA